VTLHTGFEVQQLPMRAILPGGRNPRRKLTGVEELAASLATHGLLQPILVRPHGKRYELVAGNRRFAAARSLGWKTISAVVRPENDDEAFVLTLVENLQREDLSPREEADALQLLVRERGWNTRQVASAIQRSQAFVSKRLRVFEDPILAPAVLGGQVSVSTAEELLSADPRRRYDILVQAIEEQWDRARVRLMIRETGGGRPKRKRGLSRRAHELRLELRGVRPDTLSEQDRRELRLLFTELAMLARAKPQATPFFPPLPQAPNARSRR
jgi:ParB family transcriptional regulator, chromosome partitioning protein